MRWTRKGIVAEIQQLHRDGIALNYASAETNHLQLMRAAAWHFGTWRHAVETAGIDYQALSKYRRWGRERIIERIRELHHEGSDLSWRSVSLEIDPALAAAALRPNGFTSWRQAIAAAGLNIEEVARYQAWDAKRVVDEIRALQRGGEPMSSKLVQISNQSLFCAARRRFGSWDEALRAAGLDVSQIRLRQPSHAANLANGRKALSRKNGLNSSPTPTSRAATTAASQGASGKRSRTTNSPASRPHPAQRSAAGPRTAKPKASAKARLKA